MESDHSEPPERLPERPDPAEDVALRTQVAQLRAEVARLENAVEHERRRRQTVIDRYEHLLAEREGENAGERRSGRLFRRFLK
jgi:hypothetical protein